MSVPRVTPRSRAVVLLWHKLGDCKRCPTIKLKRGREQGEEGEEVVGQKRKNMTDYSKER